MRHGAVTGVALGCALIGVVAWQGARAARPPQLCPEGLVLLGPRCCGEGQHLEAGACRGEPSRCSLGLERTAEGCVSARKRVELPSGRVERRPTDWDDVSARGPEDDVAAFAIDATEVVERDYRACVTAGACTSAPSRGEPGLPQTDVTAAQARAYCAYAGGTLPTTAQFAFAGMGRPGRRYPWGDAGAVCRRVVYGMATGPCATGASGPELAGARPAGGTPEGVLDLAGNVDEWVRSPDGFESRGGSWADASVTVLRTFSARAIDAGSSAPTLGFRCVYPAGAK